MNAPPFQRPLRVLSMRQPWATLLARRMKMNETRSWQSNYRGLVAIHASATMSKEECSLCESRHFKDALARCHAAVNLPLGSIIGVGCLDAITPTDNYEISIFSMEYAFGNYGPNRFVWHFNDMRSIAPIHGIRGHLGLWTPSEYLHEKILVASGHDQAQPARASTTPVTTKRETQHDMFRRVVVDDEVVGAATPTYLTGRLKRPL